MLLSGIPPNSLPVIISTSKKSGKRKKKNYLGAKDCHQRQDCPVVAPFSPAVMGSVDLYIYPTRKSTPPYSFYYSHRGAAGQIWPSEQLRIPPSHPPTPTPAHRKMDLSASHKHWLCPAATSSREGKAWRK